MFESLFDHQSFTGRSGTFFGYEGLGSIYWHMVSKLLLAAQESFFRAADVGASATTLRQLAACYYDIRAGIGDAKAPDVYGAFPMDPYSHTPAHAGARQPGLTGEVKEDILCRWGELGVFVQSGQLCFRPLLLRRSEFLSFPADFDYWDTAGQPRRLRLKTGSLAFTYCQTPVIYRLGGENSLAVWFADGSRRERTPCPSDVLCAPEPPKRWFLPLHLGRRGLGSTAVELSALSNAVGASPSPPLEERVGERRPFPRAPLNSTALGLGRGGHLLQAIARFMGRDSLRLDAETSQSIFERKGVVDRIVVSLSRPRGIHPSVSHLIRLDSGCAC
jgi:hypothetical protein